jgi:hypothetical protein
MVKVSLVWLKFVLQIYLHVYVYVWGEVSREGADVVFVGKWRRSKGIRISRTVLITNNHQRPPIYDNNKTCANSVEYAQCVKMLGNGRLEAKCQDGETRLGQIRGQMRKKVSTPAGVFTFQAVRPSGSPAVRLSFHIAVRVGG